MIHRVVEITGEQRHLCKYRGFLVIREGDQELGRLPLDDLELVLVASQGMTCTGSLLNELASRCIPLVVCDHRFLPVSVLWPVESHSLQSRRIQAQARMSMPLRKRLWQQLVREKILRQAEVLTLCIGQAPRRFKRLADTVRSGDPGNVEGEAARLYWPLLFGPAFRRDTREPGINALLNYTYTVLRAAVARAVMLAGLHPAFGLHHCNQRDTMPLVDDLIEPFRPVADLIVYELAGKEPDILELTPAIKKYLIEVTTIDMIYAGVVSPVSECLLRMTRSLAEICLNRKKKLELPDSLHRTEDSTET